MAINSLPAEQNSAVTLDVGHRNYINTVMRLTRMELYKIYRRRYNTVVVSALLGLVVVVTVITGIFAFSQAQAQPSAFAPPRCLRGGQYCITQTLSPAQLEQLKTAKMQDNAQSLGLPESLLAIVSSLVQLTALLGIILLGTIAGTEYGLGTIRLLFTRGPTRLQCMFAKVIASLVYTALVLLLIVVVYVILGMILYPLTGEPYSYAFGFFSQANFGAILWHVLLLWIIAIGSWFTYAMLAFFFGTLGRSTAAGIGGAFVWYILEIVLNNVLGFLQTLLPAGWLHDFVRAVPDYLLSNNLSALALNQMHTLQLSVSSSISSIHAAIVSVVYLVILIGVSCVITMRRDVTN